MTIKVRSMGNFQTNCYIVGTSAGDFIIDPGVDAVAWVKQNVQKPLALLNTHGHFDHVWSNTAVKQALNIPLYCPKDDVFMLTFNPFELGMPPSTADYLVAHDEVVKFGEVVVWFHFFAGHTPGCSAIEISENGQSNLFSGDFIFNGGVGRTDFPYSSSADMIQSIEKILQWERDIDIYPGHGPSTTLSKERKNLHTWIEYLR